MIPVPCIVPAAGCSSRMGDWKPMLRFGGVTIIETVVGNALAVCGRVLLVTGYRGEELAAIFQGRSGVHIIENQDWEIGMFSSIQCATRELETERFFITLGDKPLISPEVYRSLLLSHHVGTVFPVFGGVRGHPVLLDAGVAEAILQEDPARGSMQEILRGFTVHEIPWTDDSILRDIDTPEEYKAAIRTP
jgi:molybdenum cofactor cytidylyltransferase